MSQCGYLGRLGAVRYLGVDLISAELERAMGFVSMLVVGEAGHVSGNQRIRQRGGEHGGRATGILRLPRS